MKADERREREIAHARSDILDAAIRAFARTGLHATTVQDIAQEAGYTAASLYTYFKSKQDLLDAVVNLLTDEYVQVFEQPVPGGLTFRQRFELVLRRHLELVDKRRNLFASFISQRGEAGATENHNPNFHANFERRIQRLAAWLRDNAGPHDLGGYTPEIAARLLYGMAFGLLHLMGETADKKTFTDYAPLITEFFFHGVSGKPQTGAHKK
jgi:AcrR family transcriptional regulator